MGCNNTKLNSSEGEGLPAKLRPLLRQRIEEFRKRRNVRGGEEEEGNLSKKQLLKDDDNDHYHHDGNYQTHSSYKNKVVETETQPPKEQTVVRVVVPVENLSKVVPFPLPASECETDEQLKKEKDVEKKPEIPIIAMPQQESKQEEGNPKHNDDHDDEEDDDDDEDDEDEDDDDDDEDDEESEFGRYIGPGSPSFRIYCIEAEKRKEKEIRDANARYKNTCHEEKEKEQEQEKEKEEQKETIRLHNKSPSTGSDESATSASASGNEVVEMERPAPLKRRRRHKMKKLKKNLLNVKNIPMNRMMACTGNNDRRSLLANK